MKRVLKRIKNTSLNHFVKKIITSIRNSQFPLTDSLTYLSSGFITNEHVPTAACFL